MAWRGVSDAVDGAPQETLRVADVDAIEPCELFKLSKEDFNDMTVLFPASKVYMLRIADARLQVLG